jgi:hypothetical protein
VYLTGILKIITELPLIPYIMYFVLQQSSYWPPPFVELYTHSLKLRRFCRQLFCSRSSCGMWSKDEKMFCLILWWQWLNRKLIVMFLLCKVIRFYIKIVMVGVFLLCRELQDGLTTKCHFTIWKVTDHILAYICIYHSVDRSWALMS